VFDVVTEKLARGPGHRLVPSNETTGSAKQEHTMLYPTMRVYDVTYSGGMWYLVCGM